MHRLASPLPPSLAELCSQTVAGPRNGLSEPGEPAAERSGMVAGARSVHQDMPFPGETGRTPKRAPCRLRKPPGPPVGRPTRALLLGSDCTGTQGNSARSHGAPRVCLWASLSLRQDRQTQLSLHGRTLGNARSSAAPSYPDYSFLYLPSLPAGPALGLAGILGKRPWLSASLPCRAGPACRVCHLSLVGCVEVRLGGK